VVGSTQLSWRRRAARLGWSATALALLSLLVLGVAVWAATASGQGASSDPAVLFGDPQWRLWLTLAGVAGVVAAYLGVAALETAAAMRVLAPDRPLPARQPGVRRPGPTDLAALVGVSVVAPPEWPPTAVPSRADAVQTVRCTVLIPARNEELVIVQALRSLHEQTRRPDRVLVIADNCTDATVRVAREHGVEVVESVDNLEKKAGALNQQLKRLLPGTDERDVILVMDADSTIGPEFLEAGLRRLEEDPSLTAIGGLFDGEPGYGLIGQFQRNEYSRYQRVVARKSGRVFVLTGTASLIRAYALAAVAQARGDLVPGVHGDVYDTRAMTEDNELTLALKSLGAKLTSPRACHVTTELMPTWRALWRQRLRWQRGALENIGAYGLTRATALYWAQQLTLAYGVIALNSFLLLSLITLLAADELAPPSLFWTVIGVVFVVERVATVWSAGWRARAMAAVIFLELGYALFLQACFVASLAQVFTGKKAGWNYVSREPASLGAATVVYGVLLPTTVLSTDWYAALAQFVAINTLIFGALAIAQLLPARRRKGKSGR
jgi:cellulose synthase/poly-beta-1,6-N-acetylglucosamine synthase-like glycosyltransferase